jgi:uncharacterized lipoprotein YddW (UPF0748 family)
MKLLFPFFYLIFFLTLDLQGNMRGAWIASVHNINFPSKPGLSESAQKTEVLRLLDTAKAAGLNAVLLQVRPEGDALYESHLEPWSRYLTGAQGRSPGYDPLAFFISQAKTRGLAVHAWINPYRAAANASHARASNHISRRLPQYAYKIGNILWMDPGAPQVRRHINDVVRDLITRYSLAGIHLDDYFYPYPSPKGGLPKFPDDKTHASYIKAGGTLSKSNWRRHNVNTLIKELDTTIHSIRPNMQFGVSPFGIYTKGSPPDVKAGVDQYNELFSDPLAWMKEGWIDYLAPQLYWPDSGPQSFSSLLRWWRHPTVNPRGVPILPGIALDRMASHGWDRREIDNQLKIEKSTSPRNGGGFLLWNIDPLAKNTNGILKTIRSY